MFDLFSDGTEEKKSYDLARFKDAQKFDYKFALKEIRHGRKEGHWIWYIFPQVKGLGSSGLSDYYGISGLDEAKAYMKDPILKKHLLEISEALLKLKENDPLKIMGFPDDLKLRSSMTLFREAAPECEVFQKVLDKFYGGEPDSKTLEILKKS